MGWNGKLQIETSAPLTNWTVPPDSQEIEQLRMAARLSWSEKLQWLEEMQRMVEFIQRPSEQSDLQPSNQPET